MRRRPQREAVDPSKAPAPPVQRIDDGQNPFNTPSWQGDAIRPWIVSGGEGRLRFTEGFTPIAAGTQLVAHVWVPPGRVGFLKQLCVAPGIHPIFGDPFRGWDATWQAQYNLPAETDPAGAPAAQHGLWETPMAWEAYADVDGAAPAWRWQLRTIAGKINPAPFSLADPSTWFLQPDIAVPTSAAYPQGLPGGSPLVESGPNRFQILPNDQLALHVLIPAEHTLCLFAQWTQAPAVPIARDMNGDIIVTGSTEFQLYPLLGSVGRMAGYSQAADRGASQGNAMHGWGG